MGNDSKLQWLIFSAALLITMACAGKHPARTEVFGPGYENPPAKVEDPLPSEPDSTPFPGNSSDTQRSHARPKIGLVLGGHGVASFATIGVLKRLNEEGIRLDFVVASGWPAVFALEYGFSKSVHNLEWFAMQLEAKDFRNAPSRQLQSRFGKRSMQDTWLPVYFSAQTSTSPEMEIFDHGDWQEPLSATLATPQTRSEQPQGIDVDEALRRGTKIAVAVSFYDDYIKFAAREENQFAQHLNQQIQRDSKKAVLNSRIALGVPPQDFSARRRAIQRGYQEGKRLAKRIRGMHANRDD